LSLKENINMVKDELNSEEKFFEKAVMTERFVKKYKKAMIGGVAAVVVLVAANMAYEFNQSENVKEANIALSSLLKDPKSVEAKDRLKSLSPELYDVWAYSQALADKDLDALKKLSTSKTLIISDLASYEVASASADAKALEKYSMKQNAIYKDLALVQNAILHINNKETAKAHQELRKISQESALSKVSEALQHYGVK
jgi:hypothetical protein